MSFQLLVRPLTTVGVFTTTGSNARRPFNLFEDELRPLVECDVNTGRALGCMIVPAIHDPAVCRPPSDSVRWDRRDNTVWVTKQIDWSLWRSASSDGRIALFADNIVASIQAVPSKYIDEIIRKKIAGAVPEIAIRAKKGFLH